MYAFISLFDDQKAVEFYRLGGGGWAAGGGRGGWGGGGGGGWGRLNHSN